MIIKHILIHNFGGLVNKEIFPERGLNVIYGVNEAGKSTVAEFIKAMLYGMDNNMRDIRENERLRYMPFESSFMSGIMEVENDGITYHISRKFGRRKSEDMLKVTNAVTGAQIELDGMEVGEYLTGLKQKGFMKTSYIKQLSTKITADKDDEILKMLVNLTQTGDEKTSYKKSQDILDEAMRSLSFRSKGKIPELKESLSQLFAEKMEIQRAQNKLLADAQEMARLEQEKDKLEREKTDDSVLNRYREKYLGWQAERKHTEFKHQLEKTNLEQQLKTLKATRSADKLKRRGALVFGIITAVLSCGAIWYPLMLTILAPFVVATWMYFRANSAIKHSESEEFMLKQEFANKKWSNEEEYVQWFKENMGIDVFEKIPDVIDKCREELNERREENTRKIVALTEMITGIKHRIMMQNTREGDAVEAEIINQTVEVKRYEEAYEHLRMAKETLEEAFQDLQMEFGPKLNEGAARVLSRITMDRYSGVKVDEGYNIVVVDDEGKDIKGEYLSTGAYDQIYFALRMGIINLVAPDVPMILDDALSQYDDKRHKAVMEYIGERENQTIIFTCHSREDAGHMIEL